ncbi:MAG: TIM barrel protein [Candidatus Gastranaerophilaceae bacterium]|jgi:endonuclease IV
MFELGLKLFSTNDYYVNEAKRLYEEGHYDYIELYSVPDSYNDFVNIWKKLDIPFIIHAPHFGGGLNLSKKECLNNNLKLVKEAKKFADELDSEFIIFHGGIGGNMEETAKQLKSFNEHRALIENKPYKVFPKLANDEACVGYNFCEINYIINVTGCGFCLDFGHVACSANSQGKDIYYYFEEFLNLKPKMFHLTDIKDITSEYDSHPHLGEGEFNIKKILSMLSLNDKITIETIKNSKANLNDFMKDIKFLREVYETK